MARESYHERFLDAGLQVMFQNGYTGSGIRDIAAAADAPHGSFINHFGSKEGFALEVLDRYFQHVQEVVAQALGDRTLTPRERLLRYLDLITEILENDGYLRGCLIGDFSLETPAQSEALRARLGEIYAEWRSPFAACIAEGQASGEIAATFEAAELADFLLASWEGAILRMKVDRHSAALERFKTIAFQTIFTHT